MRPRVGIVSGALLWSATSFNPKRDLLVFDRIVVSELEQWRSQAHLADELDWLVERGLIVPFKVSGPDLVPVMRTHPHLIARYEQVVGGAPIEGAANEIEELMFRLVLRTGLEGQIYSIVLRNRDDVDACPLVPSGNEEGILGITPLAQPETPSRHDVLRIVLKALPVPDDSTPWTEILEFRQDAETGHKLMALRQWAADISKGNLSRPEIEDKIEWLLAEYERHMRLHKLKTSAGVIETIVTTGAEFAEDLFRVRWGKLAKSLFDIKRRGMELLDEEAKAPGKELAYVAHARKRFALRSR